MVDHQMEWTDSIGLWEKRLRARKESDW